MNNLDKLFDEDFRGNIYVVRDNMVLYQKSSGYADLANEVPNTLETKFASASAGKVFVAVAIMILIEQGKLNLDNTLGELLDINLNNIDPLVTVRQLLNHTSGVPDYFDESVMDEYEELWVDYPNYKIRHNNDLFPLFINKEMMYEKGERFQYNNSGYVLLASIIEKLSGMYFDEFIQKNIFDKCDMNSTGYYELDRLPSKCASNYIEDEEGSYRTNIFSVDVKGTGAGGAFITVTDIVKFWQSLIRGDLISQESFAMMTSIQSSDEENEEYYGYGMWINVNTTAAYQPFFEGCDPGVSFISMYNPNDGTIAVVVSNYEDDVWNEMRTIKQNIFIK